MPPLTSSTILRQKRRILDWQDADSEVGWLYDYKCPCFQQVLVLSQGAYDNRTDAVG